MIHSRRTILCWVLIVTLVTQGLVPVFGEVAQSTSSLYDRYQAAYKEYTDAVASGASLDEIQPKLDVYLSSYAAYRESIQASNGQSVSEQPLFSETSSPSSSPDEAIALEQAQAADESEIVDDSQKSWFSRAFDRIKELISGSAEMKQMPLWEKILWNIGKAIVPSMGVMIATALLAPLSPIAMVAGGIFVGAALGGLMTYAFEKRMNAKYRATPKDEAKIWRDVTVQATVEAVMAPFNLATGGLFGMVGPSVGKAIGRVAVTQALLTFSGKALSSSVGGAVKHLWAKHYFKYPEKIEANEKRIDEILNSHVSSQTPFTEAELAELESLQSEIDSMKSEDYTHEDLSKDLKRAALTGAISGFAGSIISDKLYDSSLGRLSDKISVKLFGSVAKGKAISSLVSTLPINFTGGFAGANLEKSFIDQDIKSLRDEQSRFAPGSAAYDYYETIIRENETKRSAIDPAKVGVESMLSNFALRAAQLSVEAIKYNVYDGPKARKQAIESIYRKNDENWQKAEALKEKYLEIQKNVPNPLRYRNPVTYARALANYHSQLDSARKEWVSQSLIAQQMESTAQNQSAKEAIAFQYDRDMKLNQMLELGRLSGGTAHLNAMKEVLKAQNPGLANTSDEQLTLLAAQAIQKTYADKYTSSSNKVSEIEETLKSKEDLKSGKLQLSSEEAKILEGQAALISPSQYKAALIERTVYDLKANNVRWTEVERRMPDIIAQAEKEMLQQYGNNWVTVMTAEVYANGLAKYKYDPDGKVSLVDEMKKLAQKIPRLVESGVLGEYKKEVNNAITTNIIPQQTDNDLENYLNVLGKGALTGASSGILDSIYGISRDQLIYSFNR